MKVAVAVITDEQHRVLITQRPYHRPHGGCWEFPGGKLEEDEPSEAALIREVREEVGLTINQYQCLGQVTHHYSDKTVTLIVFLVTGYIGTPICLEGQPGMKWMLWHELKPEHFPEANHKVMSLVARHLSTTRSDLCAS